MAIGVSGVCDSSMGDGLYNHAIYVIGHKRLHKLTQSNDIGFVGQLSVCKRLDRSSGLDVKTERVLSG